MFWIILFCLIHIPVHVKSTYLLIKTGGEDWTVSRQRCLDLGWDLALIKDSAELEDVKQYVNGMGGPDKEMWIGMIWDTANQVHKWLDGDVVTWSPWTATEPNCMSPPALGCFYQDENYVRMTTDFYFRTHVINQLYDVLCESPSTTTIATTTTTTTTTMVSTMTSQSTSNLPTNQESESGLPLDVIIGLAAGFGSFVALCCMCCCIWKIFCADKDDNKIDQAPDIKVVTAETTEKLKIDNPWMKHEEISFCLRQKYVFDFTEEITGKRHKYIK